MIRNAREYVNPRDWDEGVSAVLLKYDANVCCTGASAGTGYKQFGAGVSGGIVAYGGVACRLLERANRELAIERARKRQTLAFVACHIPLIEVIRLFGAGNTVGAIAAQLHRSKQTINAHKTSAMKKRGIAREVDLIRYVDAVIFVDSPASSPSHTKE